VLGPVSSEGARLEAVAQRACRCKRCANGEPVVVRVRTGSLRDIFSVAPKMKIFQEKKKRRSLALKLSNSIETLFLRSQRIYFACGSLVLAAEAIDGHVIVR
jgi:fumarylacetoacetate (FAA) hydrolase family protein